MYKKIGLKKLLPAMMLLASLALLTCCRTCPDPVKPSPVKIDWLVFPDPTGLVTVSPDRKTVMMPTAYWLQIAQYVIDTESGITIYEGIK